MARKSLRPHLNQIRTWTRQGRTDAWVAHQLEVSVQEVETFRRQNGLLDGEDLPGGPVGDDDEIDLRAADEALIAAELEAAALATAEAERELAEKEAAEAAKAAEDGPRTRRRSYRSGSSRRSNGRHTGPLEGTFDHGEEGYGLWLDPAVSDDPIYAEHWAGHRPIQVLIEEDQIVIRRLHEEPARDDAGDGDDDDDSDDE
jgi:hypothetical protein